LENGPVVYATSRYVPHCYELCALNPYFSQRLRARQLAPSSHLRMAKRHGRRASRSRRGIKRPVTENRRKREQSRPFAVYNRRDDNARRKCSHMRTRTSCVFRRKGNHIVYRRQLYSRRKIVSTHARARDATCAHTSAHAARNKRETSTMDLITKSGTISWEFAGNGDLRNSPDCYRELRITMLPSATRELRFTIARGICEERACMHRVWKSTIFASMIFS